MVNVPGQREASWPLGPRQPCCPAAWPPGNRLPPWFSTWTCLLPGPHRFPPWRGVTANYSRWTCLELARWSGGGMVQAGPHPAQRKWTGTVIHAPTPPPTGHFGVALQKKTVYKLPVFTALSKTWSSEPQVALGKGGGRKEWLVERTDRTSHTSIWFQ